MILKAFYCFLFAFWQVGSDFGYFPKDLLEINHNYSNEELELPTDVSLICDLFFLFNWAAYCFLARHSIKSLRGRMGISVICSYLLLVSSYTRAEMDICVGGWNFCADSYVDGCVSVSPKCGCWSFFSWIFWFSSNKICLDWALEVLLAGSHIGCLVCIQNSFFSQTLEV